MIHRMLSVMYLERVSEDSGVQFGEVILSEHRHEDHKALVLF